MKEFVLDCSVTIAWLCNDETDQYSGGVLDLLATAKAVVPALWPYEVLNALIVAERRKRMRYADVLAVLDKLQRLPIVIQERTLSQLLSELLVLTRRTGLSAYDAAYLSLAMQLSLPLATIDQRLSAAARSCGIALL